MELMVKLIVLLPLFSAAIAGLMHRQIGDKNAQYLTTGVLIFITLLSWIVFVTHEGTAQYTILRWIHSGDFSADWGIRLDRITQVMLVVVTTVSALVHYFSMEYMAHDHNFKEGESYRPRFFAYLSFFTFTMLMLVTADNFLQLFFGWEGVGVASYLLIGFYFRKQSAGEAAIKAFIMNRVGDFGLALGIFAIFLATGSLQFDAFFEAAPSLAAKEIHFLSWNFNAIELMCVLLFIGAMGKSAQFLLHNWLPDAMEGPTPVSALIHAATMVTAGVFLMARFSPAFEYAPAALGFVTYLGAITAFIAATIGLVQTDIKRVIAYSTMSQLGYMFAAAGVGVYEAAMFHLFTHAFFKAMLFLGAGSVIHSMHHEQDMRNYGGLKNKMPYTWAMMMIGTLAITGVGIPLTTIGFAGFVSKDAIIESTYAAQQFGIFGSGFAFWMLVMAAFMTAFYSWRLMFLTFWGTPRGDAHTHEHAHENNLTILIPLFILSVGAILGGIVFYKMFFGGHGEPEAWFAGAIYSAEHHQVLHAAHEVPKWVKLSPFVAMALGLALSWLFYIKRPDLPEKTATQFSALYNLFVNKWYWDKLYDAVFRRPTIWLGNFLWKRGDVGIIDKTIDTIALKILPAFQARIGRWQDGLIYSYALTMIIGVVAVLFWLIVRFGGA